MSLALANLTTRLAGGAAMARLLADEDRRAPRLAKAAARGVYDAVGSTCSVAAWQDSYVVQKRLIDRRVAETMASRTEGKRNRW